MVSPKVVLTWTHSRLDPLVSSELTNLPEKVQEAVSSSLEQSGMPILEEVCSLRSTVEETMASTKASVETVKSSVEAVGRVVEDVQKNEAEGIEELKRSVEEASSCIMFTRKVQRTCPCYLCAHLSRSESRASRPCCFRNKR